MISLLNTQNFDEGIRKLILKLPLLCFPLVLIAFKTVIPDFKKWLILIFAYALYLPGIVSVYNYFSNKTLFDDLILQSKPLPIEFGYGIYHIQFSVLIAASIIIGLYWLINLSISKKFDFYFYILLFLVISNFIIIHVLTARTGILSLYAALFVLILIKLTQMQFKTKLLVAISIVVLPTVMLLSSPALKNRLINSIEDVKVLKQGKDVNDYSFAMRVEAWKNAVNVIGKHPYLGVGIGDVEAVLNDNFITFNPSILPKNRKNPHLQFLETMVESGVLNGLFLLLFFLILFVVGITLKSQRLALLLGVVFFISCLFESILERQATVVGFALLLAFTMSLSIEKESV
ncbi:MAG: O-antigen ligase family protein [Bacteroidota bacterium]|nr:O-antigen ligase family protein [Bacteroidota bacterium]